VEGVSKVLLYPWFLNPFAAFDSDKIDFCCRINFLALADRFSMAGFFFAFGLSYLVASLMNNRVQSGFWRIIATVAYLPVVAAALYAWKKVSDIFVLYYNEEAMPILDNVFNNAILGLFALMILMGLLPNIVFILAPRFNAFVDRQSS
jgi:hypothetical protein